MNIDLKPCSAVSVDPTPCLYEGCDGTIKCVQGSSLTWPSTAVCGTCCGEHVVLVSGGQLVYGKKSS